MTREHLLCILDLRLLFSASSSLPVPGNSAVSPGAASMPSFLHRLWRSYNALLLSRPLATKTVTAVCIGALGDTTCQLLEKRQRKLLALAAALERQEKEGRRQEEDVLSLRPPLAEEHIDIKRTLRFATWIALVTPIVHHWYRFLTLRFPGSPLKRMVTDQVLFAPVGTAAMMVAVSAFENPGDLQGSKEEATKKLQRWPQVMLANYATWPLFMWFNFRYIPPQLNVLAVNAASFFWAIYLSSKLTTTTLQGEPSEAAMKAEGWEPEGVFGTGPSFASHYPHPHQRRAYARSETTEGVAAKEKPERLE